MDAVKNKEFEEKRNESEMEKISRDLIVSEPLPVIESPLDYRKWDKVVRLKTEATKKSRGGRVKLLSDMKASIKIAR